MSIGRSRMSRILAFLGARAAWLMFTGVFVGLLLPDLAALCRPLLAPAVVAILAGSLLRVDWRRLGDHARRPMLAVLLVGWLMVVAPTALWVLASPVGLPPALLAALVLMAAAPPILGSAFIALVLGLDAALALLIALAATLVAPLTVPPVALVLLGLELSVGLGELMARLATVVAAAFALFLAVRRLAPAGWLEQRAAQIDGALVFSMLVFAVAIMDGVQAALLERPMYVGLLVLAAFVANPVLQVLGATAFAWLGRRAALTIGLMTGNCNMGLLLASLPASADFEIQMFFAVAQLPMFMLPALLAPLYRRLLGT
jgi:BASS family bile acid:Na+ symporter